MDATTPPATPTTTLLPSPTPSPTPDGHAGPVAHMNPAVAFLIGALIILAASAMNAAGLNITKMDHVKTHAQPKHARRSQLLRPLWILGMSLYILSQLLGSTLALQYLRAEYVAPLGATSLIFNFLFASWLVGTPVTRTDIRGTVIVILGVIGIVVFGSIHSPDLSNSVDLARLKHLWSRAAWWGYFLLMALGTLFTYLGSSLLESALHARDELELPVHAPPPPVPKWLAAGRLRLLGVVLGKAGEAWRAVQGKVERVVDASDDKFLSWVLAMGWSCCGGALAGGTLVFAKACVNLLALGGASFLSPAALLTLLLLILTAVAQIVCLNRGLEAWDSTLVVPVFYGIYTCSGFLDSLIFYNEVPYYQFWVLAAIFLSILVLIAGVILLSTKKPEKARVPHAGPTLPASERERQRSRVRNAARTGEESVALRSGEADAEGEAEAEVMWELGSVSDEGGEAGDGAEDLPGASAAGEGRGKRPNGSGTAAGAGEGKGLMVREGDQEEGEGEGEGDDKSVRALSIRTARSRDAPEVDRGMLGLGGAGAGAGEGFGEFEGAQGVWR